MVPIITSYLDFLIFSLKELIYSPTLKYSSCSENKKYSQFWCSYYSEVVTEKIY